MALMGSWLQLSGQRVLVMEWIDGVKLSDKGGMVGLRIRPRDAALQLLKAFAEMIFVHGTIHGDPHGGNILVRPHPGPPCEAHRSSCPPACSDRALEPGTRAAACCAKHGLCIAASVFPPFALLVCICTVQFPPNATLCVVSLISCT